MKVVLKRILLLSLCCLFFVGWMCFSHCAKNFVFYICTKNVASALYSDDLEWMQGKTVEEIEERYGPVDITELGWKMYYLSEYWAIDVDSPTPEITMHLYDYPYTVLPDAALSFALDGVWYYILNFFICTVVFSLVVVLPYCVRRKRKLWNAYLDADQAYRKSQAESVEVE